MAGRNGLASRLLWALAIAAVVSAALLLIPIPYIIFGPGAAVDLSTAITVPNHHSPPGRFYLTDVNILPGRPFFYATAKVLPGFEIIRRRELVPPSMSDRDLDRFLVDAMKQSQVNAQIVAERAAGLPVKAKSSFVVLRTVRKSPGSRCFRPGDKIANVGGRRLVDADSLAKAATTLPAGTRFVLGVQRAGRLRHIRCATFKYQGKARFGITGQFQTDAYSLPVHVSYRLPNINGSSAGLMFALQIYRSITGMDIAGGRDVAGTGVLGVDGRVGPIEGAREKIRAAIKSKASIFFVPVENYAAIKHVAGIDVIPVKSFQEALGALKRATRSR